MKTRFGPTGVSLHQLGPSSVVTHALMLNCADTTGEADFTTDGSDDDDDYRAQAEHEEGSMTPIFHFQTLSPPGPG